MPAALRAAGTASEALSKTVHLAFWHSWRSFLPVPQQHITRAIARPARTLARVPRSAGD